MRPLDGLTVISIEQAVAAPFATRQLADLGARVIKVERPGPGDFARDYHQTVNGMSSHFVWLNRSKESIALDLKTDAAYNAHRIHYDHNWVREEGYGDLVVHGPLQALMMGELIRRSGDGLVGRQFAYRLVSPMIGPQTFTVLAAEDGVNSGAEVRDSHGTVTAVSTVGPTDPVQD